MIRRTYLFGISLLMLFSSLAKMLFANAGIFTGNGHDIMLTQSNDVEMLSEDITITPGRGMFLVDGSPSGLDRVEYDCVFKLKNLRDVPVTVQVGFPLDAESLAHQRGARSGRNAEPLTLRDYFGHCRFIAHDGATTYPLRFAMSDKSGEFRNLFVWDMTFQPGEAKTLYVIYEMPMSLGMASTLQKPDDIHALAGTPWTVAFTGGLAEFFAYVTQTGKSWAGGRIGHARFTLDLGGFETYLFSRKAIEGETKAEKRQKIFPVIHPATARVIKPKPDEWENAGKGKMVREIKHYIPDENIEVRYYMMNMPGTAEGVRQLIAHLRNEGFAKTSATAGTDFDLLRDFFRAFNGERTQNAAANEIAEKQVWFGIAQPCKIPEVVFETLEQLRAAMVQPTTEK